MQGNNYPVQSSSQSQLPQAYVVPINKEEMHLLAHDSNKLQFQLIKLIQLATTTHQANPSKALVYLVQAQKLLEYVASCGMNIDKKYISLILHNQAFCYQQLWQLDKCSVYLQALIFNFLSELQQKTPTPINKVEQLIDMEQLENHRTNRLYGESISCRLQLCEYYLQYCAINSENGNHKIARKSANTAIEIIRGIFSELYNSQQFQTNPDQKSILGYSERLAVLKIIGGIHKMPRQFSINQAKDYIKTIKYYIEHWGPRQQQQNNPILKQSIKNFSIGHIMKMQFIGLKENNIESKSGFYTLLPTKYLSNLHHNNDTLLGEIDMITLVHQALLLSVAFFTLSTQIRLQEKMHQHITSEQFSQSEVYNLIAMIILLVYVPYDTFLMKHIFTSYTNNYRDIFSLKTAFQNGTILKKQFDACMYGISQNNEPTKIYFKPSDRTKLTDQMKTVEFMTPQQQQKKQYKRSKSIKSISSKCKYTEMKIERKNSTFKQRSRSQVFRLIGRGTCENIKIRQQNEGSQPRKKYHKKRSTTALKHKYSEKFGKQKNTEEKKKKQKPKISEYYQPKPKLNTVRSQTRLIQPTLKNVKSQEKVPRHSKPKKKIKPIKKN